jgi:hypothetical protein
VFTEENSPENYVKLVASGQVDATLLDAIEDYVKRQKKRLEQPRDSVIGRIFSDSDDDKNKK